MAESKKARVRHQPSSDESSDSGGRDGGGGSDTVSGGSSGSGIGRRGGGGGGGGGSDGHGSHDHPAPLPVARRPTSEFLSTMTGFLAKVQHTLNLPSATSRSGGRELIRTRTVKNRPRVVAELGTHQELLNAFTRRDGTLDEADAMAIQYMPMDAQQHGVTQILEEEDEEDSDSDAVADVLAGGNVDGDDDDDDDGHDLYQDEEGDGLDLSPDANQDWPTLEQRVAKMEAQCPPGWIVHLAELYDNEPFYYHAASGERVWSLEEVQQLEKEIQQQQPQQQQQQPSVKGADLSNFDPSKCVCGLPLPPPPPLTPHAHTHTHRRARAVSSSGG